MKESAGTFRSLMIMQPFQLDILCTGVDRVYKKQPIPGSSLNCIAYISEIRCKLLFSRLGPNISCLISDHLTDGIPIEERTKIEDCRR